jgi:hypothetical protein
MTEAHPLDQPVAVFWDQSLLWGLICVETLERLSVPFHLLSAEDIARGSLDGYRVLIVPGGWASHKFRALGDAGGDQIRGFVERGGSYLGFCGGAGLALSSPPALCMVPVERMPLSERLPSASGEVWIEGAADHPIWNDLPRYLPVSVWWPSQFSLQAEDRSLCLAHYKATGSDFMVADLPAMDFQGRSIEWESWERVYGINLNPDRLMGHPAIIEATLGQGRLILSYPHLETPGDAWGNRLFLNVLKYLDDKASSFLPKAVAPIESNLHSFSLGPETLSALQRIQAHTDELFEFGKRHLLWRWRLPWLLCWHRGIRGLEYGTLVVAIRSMVAEASKISPEHASHEHRFEPVNDLEQKVRQFCRLGERLLLEEKLAIHSGSLTKLGKVNDTVDRLRMELFGSKMNHGGLCREIFDRMDAMLLDLLRRGHRSAGSKGHVTEGA